MYWYNSRWYDSQLGRFTSPDSIIPEATQGTQAWDRFAYVNNNPVRYNDPSGHCPWCVVIGAVVGAVVSYGTQVYNNYQNGLTGADAWTTNISGEKILGGAVVGGTIGLGVGVVTVAVGSGVTAAGGAGAASAATTTVLQATGGDPSDEIRATSQAVQSIGATSNQIALGANQYWTSTTTFQGNLVYQRPDLINPFLTQGGLTNLQRMQQGLAPLGPDGSRIQLHHMLQTMNGPIAEVTQTFHQAYSSTIHINPNTIGSGIDRAAFNAWRAAYWINRAKDFIDQ